MQFARERAAELEAFHLPAGAPPTKKLCVEEEAEDGGREAGGREAGEEVDGFLAAVREVGELGEEAAKARLAELVAQLVASPSPHIRALINSGP